MRPLSHVYWLGGSACAGKTSVARLLAAAHGLTLYSCDDRFEEHRRRADPERHARFCRVAGMAPEALFSGTAEAQAAQLLAFYEDEIEMIFEDLAAIPEPVLAEGAGLLPERIADPQRAVWLISSAAVRRSFYASRAAMVQELLARCPDPDQAFATWMERDTLVAAAIERAARERGLQVLTVDGSRSIEETAAEVARRLGLTGSSM
jgi:hypothetical protein